MVNYFPFEWVAVLVASERALEGHVFEHTVALFGKVVVPRNVAMFAGVMSSRRGLKNTGFGSDLSFVLPGPST